MPPADPHSLPASQACPPDLVDRIRAWGRELGFQAVGFADLEVGEASGRLREWLAAGWHGQMDWMVRHADLRASPGLLQPGALTVISARMDYLAAPLPPVDEPAEGEGERAAIARYAQGRDYHKVVRTRLARLAERIAAAVGPCGARVFSDSAPVLEVEFARKAGLGWRGKHTLLISREAGSFFFLGEIFIDRALPPDEPTPDHCGSCTRCLSACPTGAIVAPWRLDARRCISYLTIELKGSIPESLRPLIGNRVYGCDDCQLVCPWNSFARPTQEPDFAVRQGLDSASLVSLFAWDESEFETRLAGSAIRRIGHERWLRNLAVGLGNARASAAASQALAARADHPSVLVREHVAWARARQAAGGARD
jgi:epoxyqueuosine reductase